jgi:hypothetical protein
MNSSNLPKLIMLLAASFVVGMVEVSKAQEQVAPQTQGGTFFSGSRTTNRLNDGTRDSMTLRDRAAIPPRGTGRIDRSPLRLPPTSIVGPPTMVAGARARANAATIQSRNRAGDSYRSRLRSTGPAVVPGAAITDTATQFGLQLEPGTNANGVRSVMAAKPTVQLQNSLSPETMSDDVADDRNLTIPQTPVASNSGASNGALVWQSRAAAIPSEESDSEIDSLRYELQALHAELESLRNP